MDAAAACGRRTCQHVMWTASRLLHGVACTAMPPPWWLGGEQSVRTNVRNKSRACEWSSHCACWLIGGLVQADEVPAKCCSNPACTAADPRGGALASAWRSTPPVSWRLCLCVCECMHAFSTPMRRPPTTGRARRATLFCAQHHGLACMLHMPSLYSGDGGGASRGAWTG